MENHHFNNNNTVGKSTISMAIFDSYVSLPEGICKSIADSQPCSSNSKIKSSIDASPGCWNP